MQREGGCAVVRQGHILAVVGAFLMGCAVLLMVIGCAGVRSEAPEEEQGHTEATKEQARTPKAASEEDQCEGTRTIDMLKGNSYIADSSVQPGDPETIYITNDIPGCPNEGGVLSGTDEPDRLAGEDGEDEVRGLGGSDHLSGGLGSDVVYGGPGNDELQGGSPDLAYYTDRNKDVLYGGPGRDSLDGGGGADVLYGGDGDDVTVTQGPPGPGFPRGLWGGKGEDVIHGGDGNDFLVGYFDGERRDRLYCGKGRDAYFADKNDFVDSSCEEKFKPGTRIP